MSGSEGNQKGHPDQEARKNLEGMLADTRKRARQHEELEATVRRMLSDMEQVDSEALGSDSEAYRHLDAGRREFGSLIGATFAEAQEHFGDDMRRTKRALRELDEGKR